MWVVWLSTSTTTWVTQPGIVDNVGDVAAVDVGDMAVLVVNVVADMAQLPDIVDNVGDTA